MGLDDDDLTNAESERLLDNLPGVIIFKLPRMATVHLLFNELARFAKGEYLIPFPDDYTIDQENWVELLEETLASMPQGLGVTYLHDPMYPGFTIFPVLSKKMIELQGFFMPPFFPFLFGDTWWNEIAVLSHLMFPAPVSVTIASETGHIHNYKDLSLWVEMFERTRPMREDLAIRMLTTIFGENATHLIASMPERKEALIKLQAPFQTKEFVEKWEAYGAGKYNNPHYLDLRTKAQSFLEKTCL